MQERDRSYPRGAFAAGLLRSVFQGVPQDRTGGNLLVPELRGKWQRIVQLPTILACHELEASFTNFLVSWHKPWLYVAAMLASATWDTRVSATKILSVLLAHLRSSPGLSPLPARIYRGLTAALPSFPVLPLSRNKSRQFLPRVGLSERGR